MSTYAPEGIDMTVWTECNQVHVRVNGLFATLNLNTFAVLEKRKKLKMKTMAYYYDALNDQTFQKFVQALLVTVHPETICRPVSQPGSERGALLYHAAVDRKKFVVFQVNFSISPKDKTERGVIGSSIKSEQDKVNALINKGATHY